MIMKLYSARTIKEYSKALYIKLKLMNKQYIKNLKILESCNNNKDMLCCGKIRKFQTKLKLNFRTIPTN